MELDGEGVLEGGGWKYWIWVVIAEVEVGILGIWGSGLERWELLINK